MSDKGVRNRLRMFDMIIGRLLTLNLINKGKVYAVANFLSQQKVEKQIKTQKKERGRKLSEHLTLKGHNIKFP